MPNYSGSWNLVQQMQGVAAGTWTGYLGAGTVGIFALGFFCGVGATTCRNKYTYSGCVNASATASSAASRCGSAAGNSTVSIFALGNCTTTRNKYTYSGDVNASATASSAGSSAGSAASNGTTGVNL